MNWKLAQFLGSWPEAEHLPKPYIAEVALVGRSNVGKSSLINALVGHSKLAKVSATPGKTQEFVFFEIDKKLMLVDLPGYGYAKVSQSLKKQWDQIEQYLLERSSACILLIDSRHGLMPLDEQFLGWLRHHNKPHRIILTKSDKITRQQALLAQRKATEMASEPVIIMHQGDTRTLEQIRKQIFEPYTDPAHLPFRKKS